MATVSVDSRGLESIRLVIINDTPSIHMTFVLARGAIIANKSATTAEYINQI